MTTARKRTMAELTAPGGSFPLVTRTLNGVDLQVFDRDPRTLRDAFLATRGHGHRTAVVFGDERDEVVGPGPEAVDLERDTEDAHTA